MLINRWSLSHASPEIRKGPKKKRNQGKGEDGGKLNGGRSFQTAGLDDTNRFIPSDGDLLDRMD